METENAPYLSLVMVGRNDNYGGDFKTRLQYCIAQAYKELNEAKLTAEIIFVNYNPTTENKPIEEFINWPQSTAYVTTRIITVPHTIHQQMVADGTRKNVPVLEYVAKNVGIRRANGTYILAMNPDIILTPQVVNQLKTLQENCFYRVDRVDFERLHENQTPTMQVMAAKAMKCYLKGFQYKMNGYSFAKLQMLRWFNRFKLFFHLRIMYWFRYAFLLIGWKPNPHNAEFRYHCNVSGDFMLMHRSQWFRLHANPENTFMSLHTDALMVVMAASSGLQEKILDHPIFHQDHARRYDAAQEANFEYRKVYLDFQSQAQEMIAKNQPIIYNDNQWGLYNETLPESTI